MEEVTDTFAISIDEIESSDEDEDSSYSDEECESLSDSELACQLCKLVQSLKDKRYNYIPANSFLFFTC